MGRCITIVTTAAVDGTGSRCQSLDSTRVVFPIVSTSSVHETPMKPHATVGGAIIEPLLKVLSFYPHTRANTAELQTPSEPSGLSISYTSGKRSLSLEMAVTDVVLRCVHDILGNPCVHMCSTASLEDYCISEIIPHADSWCVHIVGYNTRDRCFVCSTCGVEDLSALWFASTRVVEFVKQTEGTHFVCGVQFLDSGIGLPIALTLLLFLPRYLRSVRVSP